MKVCTLRKRALAWLMMAMMAVSLLPVVSVVGEATPMSGEDVAWSLTINQALVDALNEDSPDAINYFGVSASGTPSFELVGGALRVYNRTWPYHSLDVMFFGEVFTPLPGITYELRVTGSTTEGELLRIDIPVSGESNIWEAPPTPIVGTANAANLTFTSEIPTAGGGPDDPGYRARIRTNTPWGAGGFPISYLPEFTITSAVIVMTEIDDPEARFNLRWDDQIQGRGDDALRLNDPVTAFDVGFLATAGNPDIRIAYDADLELQYLRFPPRSADYDAIRVGGPSTHDGADTGITEQLELGEVITIRGRISGEPPAGGMVIAIDQATAPHGQGAAASVTEPNGQFMITYTVTAADIATGLNIRTRVADYQNPTACGMLDVPFYIYDLVITDRPFTGTGEMEAFLGERPMGVVEELEVTYSLRWDWHIQGITDPPVQTGDVIPFFHSAFLDRSDNPVVTIAHDSVITSDAREGEGLSGMNYLHVAPRAENWFGVRVLMFPPELEQLNRGDVITVRGRVDGTPPEDGITMALDRSTGDNSWLASQVVTATNGQFTLSHAITSADLAYLLDAENPGDEGFNIRSRDALETAFFIYDIAITDRIPTAWELNNHGAFGARPLGCLIDALTARIEYAEALLAATLEGDPADAANLPSGWYAPQEARALFQAAINAARDVLAAA